MNRPVQQANSVRSVLFSDKNYNTLQTVLVQDFQKRNGNPLNEQQNERLAKTLNHYTTQVYQVQGEKPLQILNKEILSACAKDFSQYMQRKELKAQPVKPDESLFQETSQRFERLANERTEVKAPPPPMPDFRISLDEDSPPAAELFELAKKQREMEALRSQQTMAKAETVFQTRINADSTFRTQQDAQNRTTELALVQRQSAQKPHVDLSLAIMPDGRDLLLPPIGSFDAMTGSPAPRDLGQANSNPTTIDPSVASAAMNNLPQNNIIREDKLVSYREFENNLFIYSADRDWLKNNKENRYNFSVNFDPGANGQNFGTSLGAQQRFENIVRIELVKCIMAGESLDVTIKATTATTPVPPITFNTDYQNNILNFPYITVRVQELETNNYGTDNTLDKSFGVLQYDAQWQSDTKVQHGCNKGFLAMIPKFLKCQKEFYPTPLSTLQKMTIEIRRPNGELISKTPDTFDISGIIAPPIVSSSAYNIVDSNNNPYNFFINTATYFSKFEMCEGDNIQISGYNFPDYVLDDPSYGQTVRSFCSWINRPEGHIVIGTCYGSSVTDGSNDVGYANYIVIQARYKDPSTGSVALNEFPGISSTLNTVGEYLLQPCRLINLNKQLNMVFRIITREMDSLPQIRPDNNY